MAGKAAEWCKCKEHQTNDFVLITNLYCNTFKPVKFALEYGTLDEFEEDRTLYIIGKCDVCGGMQRTGEGLPYNRKGDELIAGIWEKMKYYRPFPGSKLREDWFNRFDMKPRAEKEKIFLALFKPQDRAKVAEVLPRLKS